MQLSLANKHILVGVTGSIAAYKSPDLVRRLKEAGAIVRVMMTANAKSFITPLTLQAVSGLPVHDALFDVEAEAAMGHIELARWADLILIAPASADSITRLLQGHANDLLTAVCLATRSTIAIAPAMNQGMWENQATQQHIAQLKMNGIQILGPAAGSQACGEVGYGRMLEPSEIVEQIYPLFQTGLLAGTRVIITAGPTHEAIDPVRYITNGSSGKMGYALAQAAHEAGASVTLISGPVHLSPPPDLTVIPVISAEQMHTAVMTNIRHCDIFLSVAAVSDYRAKAIASQKMHKTTDTLTLELKRNPDIVATVAALPQRPFIVGFAAETENVIANAHAKRKRKQLDMIIANQVGHGMGIGSDDNVVTVISAQQEITLPVASKQQLARQLISLIATAYQQIPKEKR